MNTLELQRIIHEYKIQLLNKTITINTKDGSFSSNNLVTWHKSKIPSCTNTLYDLNYFKRFIVRNSIHFHGGLGRNGKPFTALTVHHYQTGERICRIYSGRRFIYDAKYSYTNKNITRKNIVSQMEI